MSVLFCWLLAVLLRGTPPGLLRLDDLERVGAVAVAKYDARLRLDLGVPEDLLLGVTVLEVAGRVVADDHGIRQVHVADDLLRAAVVIWPAPVSAVLDGRGEVQPVAAMLGRVVGLVSDRRARLVDRGGVVAAGVVLADELHQRKRAVRVGRDAPQAHVDLHLGGERFHHLAHVADLEHPLPIAQLAVLLALALALGRCLLGLDAVDAADFCPRRSWGWRCPRCEPRPRPPPRWSLRPPNLPATYRPSGGCTRRFDGPCSTPRTTPPSCGTWRGSSRTKRGP